MSDKKNVKKAPAAKKGGLIGADKIKAIKSPVQSTAPRSRGLGRGLGALIAPKPETPAASPAAPVAPEIKKDEKYIEVPIAQIDRSPWQARSVFNDESIAELAASIEENGIITPLSCRRLESGRYELIYGERRLRAAQKAGLTKVPVVVADISDSKSAISGMIENIQRENLNVIDEAEGYRVLAEQFKLTQEKIAQYVGKARATVTNLMRLLDLPDEVQQMISKNTLSMGHAKVLLTLDNATDQTILARKCVNDGLSVRNLERLIANRTAPAAKPSAKNDLPEEYVRDLCDRLHRHFGTAVRITSSRSFANGKHARGTMEIDFFNNEDLSRILDLLGVSLND